MYRNSFEFPKSVVLLLSAALCVSACGSGGETCGPGTRLEGDTCVAVCAPGAEVDPTSGLCVATCVPGTHRGADGGCIPDAAACTSGDVWDPASGACLDAETLCADGTTWVASARACVPDERLRVADQEESYVENDPNFGGPGAFEQFELPNLGETITLSGRVDAAADRDGDGRLDPDYDFWVFEAPAPMLLRIHADGLGGSMAGFDLGGVWEGSTFHRFAVGTPSDAVTRDVFLPVAGLYALVVSDGLNFLTKASGPFHGGGDLGYFIEIEQIPLPEPTPLAFSEGEILEVGDWPTAPPEAGSMIGFYSVPVQAHRAYQFGLDARNGVFSQEMFVFGAEHRFAVPGRGTVVAGWLEDDELLVVVDYAYFFSYQSGTYQLEILDRDNAWVDGTGVEMGLMQEEWVYYMGGVPGRLFGLAAEQQEVMTLRVGSTTGRTCVNVWDNTYSALFDRWNCDAHPEAAEQFEGELRVLTPYAGFYGLTTIDWAGAEFEGETAVLIPPHVYDVSLDVFHQYPRDLGDVSAPFTDTYSVASEEPERYFFMAPDAGRAVAGVVTAGFPAEAHFYQPYMGRLDETTQYQSGRFAWRSVQGEPAFFGIADPLRGGGTFQMEMAPLAITDAGPVSEAQPIELTFELAAGEYGRYFRLKVPGAGEVELQAEATAYGVALVPRGLSLAPTGEAAWLGPEPGPSVRRAVNDEGLFFEIKGMGDRPLEETVTVTVRASFVPALPEAPSSTLDDAQAVTLPAVIAGTAGGADVDWYAVTLDGPRVFTATTLPNGSPTAGDTVMLLADAEGRELAYDDDGGIATYARIEHELDQAGTYYLGVAGLTEAEGGYVLELQTREPSGGGIIILGR